MYTEYGMMVDELLEDWRCKVTLVIPDGYYNCAFHHQQAGTTRPAVCTIGVQYVGETSDFLDDSALLGGAWLSIMGELGTSIKYVRFTMATQEGIVRDLGLNVNGGESDPQASYNNAYLVHKVSILPGRRARGRMYLPGVNEVDQDAAGNIAAIKYDSLFLALGNFFTELQNRNFAAVILHNQEAGQPAPPPPTHIVGLSLDHRVATQRRRLRG